MPNHVENELKVKGPEEALDAFIKAVHGSDKEMFLDFNKIIPYPEIFRVQDELARKAFKEWEEKGGKSKDYPTIKDGYNSGGYEWCIRNWDTKWNAYDQVFMKTTQATKGMNPDWRLAKYDFETAWTPPKLIIKRLIVEHPLLSFKLKFWEGGMEFSGVLSGSKGQFTTDITKSYHGPRGG